MEEITVPVCGQLLLATGMGYKLKFKKERRKVYFEKYGWVSYYEPSPYEINDSLPCQLIIFLLVYNLKLTICHMGM